VLEADRDWEEDPRDALDRLADRATAGVRAGTRVVLVRDRGVRAEGRAWIDPLLVVAAADRRAPCRALVQRVASARVRPAPLVGQSPQSP